MIDSYGLPLSMIDHIVDDGLFFYICKFFKNIVIYLLSQKLLFNTISQNNNIRQDRLNIVIFIDNSKLIIFLVYVNFKGHI